MKVNSFIAKLYEWFRGDINREGEQQMEALAQEDAFAQEALEGYRAFAEQDHIAAIERLKGNLLQKSKNKKGFYWIKIAASIVLVIGIASMFWMLDAPMANKETSIAAYEEPSMDIPAKLQPEKDKRTAVIPDKPPVVTNPTQGKRKSNTSHRAIRKEQKKEATLKETPKVKKDMTAPPPKAAVTIEADKIQTQTQSDEVGMAEVNERKDISIPAEKKTPVPSRMILIDGIALDSVAAVDTTPLFKGIVKSIDEQPLDGVKITAFGTNVTTLTNIDGKFVFQYSPDLSALLLESDHYEPLSIPVSSPDDLTLYLSKADDNFLSGKKPAAKKRMATTSLSNKIVQPVEGFDGFGETIARAIRYPEKAKADHVEGEVELSFVVLPDGSISNVKVLASPDKALSKEAIRIFNNLPKWMNTTGESSVMTYAVPFRIKE